MIARKHGNISMKFWVNANLLVTFQMSNDKVLSGSLDIANGFNDFFSEIDPSIAKLIPKYSQV